MGGKANSPGMEDAYTFTVHEAHVETLTAPKRAQIHERQSSPALERCLSNLTPNYRTSYSPSPILATRFSSEHSWEDLNAFGFLDPVPTLERTYPVNPTSVNESVRYRRGTLYGHSLQAASEESFATLQVSDGVFTKDDGDITALPCLKTKNQEHRSCFRNPFAAAKRIFLRHIDWRTFARMVDVREFFWPFSWRMYTALFLVAVAVAAITTTEHLYHWMEKATAITRREMLPALIVVIGLEPCMMLIVLLVARIPQFDSQDASPTPVHKPDLEGHVATYKTHGPSKRSGRTALVIPCHNSDHEAMKRVLQSAFPHFQPQDIFVVDNGRSKYPTDDEFRRFIRAQHPDIRYIWSPIGSKNAAQLVGAMAATEYDFIMTIDDDVSIPTNFHPPTEKIDHLTKGVAFPVKATDANGKVPLFLVAWQDCEYRIAGLSKLAESSACGVLFPHGAGWFCERETLIQMLSEHHSMEFMAEGLDTGLSMQKMKKRIAFDASCVLETEVPTTIFGPGLNWWNQRVHSWEMGRHSRLLALTSRLFSSLNGQTTILGIFTQNLILLYSIVGILIDWIRIPILVTMGGNAHYWFAAAMLTLASIIPLLLFKYISCRRRPDLAPGFWASVTYPFYKQIYAIVSILGGIRSLLFFIGGHTKQRTIRQLIKDNDEQAFWLDPKFPTNPGYLADEGMAVRAKWQQLDDQALEEISRDTNNMSSLFMYGTNSSDSTLYVPLHARNEEEDRPTSYPFVPKRLVLPHEHSNLGL
jgi:hypothetical protein